MQRIFILTIICLQTLRLFPQAVEKRFQSIVDSFYMAKPNTIGIMLHVESLQQQLSWSYATGYSNKRTQEPLNASQPVLIASNTKTYVSASILKLMALKKLKIDQGIGLLIKKKTKKRLLKNGYKPDEITIKHLLSHTSGIADYVDDNYFAFVNTHRKYKWTRNQQIKLAMKVGKSLSMPGDTFKYADVNYLLLTEIIETCTKKPFYLAIGELVGFEKLSLNNTWFVNLQKPPAGTLPLAHQYWTKYPWDSYDLDPSWDLYGGGGIACTTKDLALFFQRLFEDGIVEDKQVLSQIYADVPCKTKTNYCLGIRKVPIAGLTGYYHGGFWGTDAIYFPDLNASVSIFILERSEKNISADICKEIVRALTAAKK